MKNIKYLLTLFIVGALLLASCQKNEPVLFSNDDSFVAFQGTSGSVVEATMVGGVPTENTIEITVMVVTLDSNPVTVDFDFEVTGIANPAVENDAFVLLNSSKTLTFPDGWGTQRIRIKTIDDDIFTGNRNVRIVLGDNSAGYENGQESSFLLTVVDDEHPLNLVLGTYQGTAPSYFYGATPLSVLTSAVDGDLTKVQFRMNQFLTGWGVPATHIVFADVDLDAMTFTIEAGQEFPTFGFGPYKITGWDGVTDDPIDDGDILKGTIAADGTITFLDEFAFRITDGGNAGLHFDIYAANWTITNTGKKTDNMPVEFVRDEPVLYPGR